MAIVSMVCGTLSDETLKRFLTENALEFTDTDNPGKRRQIYIVTIVVL